MTAKSGSAAQIAATDPATFATHGHLTPQTVKTELHSFLANSQPPVIVRPTPRPGVFGRHGHDYTHGGRQAKKPEVAHVATNPLA